MTEEKTDTIIDVHNLNKSFNSVQVHKNVSFTIPAQTSFGVLGPNGVGKTTLINILTGQVKPDSGSVSVLGHTPWDEQIELRSKIGILPEKQSPPSHFTPRSYFNFIGIVRDMSQETIETQTQKWADYLGFDEKLDTLTTDLSRGQQQKVMLAQALLHEPELVFIDEPVANLDPLMQEQVKEFIQSYVEDGNTVIVSTHNTDFAADICTDILSITDDDASVLDIDEDSITTNTLLQHFDKTW